MSQKRFYDGLDEDIRGIFLSQLKNLWTHSSTALEGNSLTLGETAFVLEEGLTVSGKPLKDHRTVEGHARAIEIVYGLIDRERVNEQELFDLHRAVIADVTMDVMRPVGAWKKESNFTVVIREDTQQQEWREYPDHVPGLMREWLERFHLSLLRDLDFNQALDAYADFHLTFVTIHPFWDGNGRMARLVSNIPVLRSGNPPAVVPLSKRREYLESLSSYQSTIGDLTSLRSLGDFPENAQRSAFTALCRSFVDETLLLLNEARKRQSERITRKDHRRMEEDGSSEQGLTPGH